MKSRARPFWPKVAVGGNDECWPYLGCRDREGYGKVRVDKRYVRAHRHAWSLHHGPIADGVVICHRCDNPPCCNPAHLFAGTPKQNTEDRLSKGRKQRLSGLSNDDVAWIRWAYRYAGARPAAIASAFGVTVWASAYAATGRRRWRDRYDLPESSWATEEWRKTG